MGEGKARYEIIIFATIPIILKMNPFALGGKGQNVNSGHLRKVSLQMIFICFFKVFYMQ